MQNVVSGLHNTEAYLDDILVHNDSVTANLSNLEQLFNKLRAYGLKINLKKCQFLATETEYLGYRISGQGIKPGTDKTEVIRKTPVPTNVKEIQSFLGLANYFRRLIPHFSALARPLTTLTSKNSGYTSGPLPTNALESFIILRDKLTEQPCIGLPDPKKPFILYVDAATGDCDGKLEGGLGAALVQPGEKGEQVVGFASRTLRDHEKNYTPYLLEMAAAVFGIETFGIYLTGRHFTLYTDHKPLETLTKRQTKTLQRLQQLMLEYSFDVKYIPGKDNVLGDWASRHYMRGNNNTTHVNIINSEIQFWAKEQDKDITLKQLKIDLSSQKTATAYKLLNNQLLIKQIDDRQLIVIPRSHVMDILRAAHGRKVAAHYGHQRTKTRILENYYWENMDKDISTFITSCEICQKGTNPNIIAHNSLKPINQEHEPNNRIHLDLFGPLISDGGNRYICVCTDSFSKFTNIWPIPDKNAETVAETFMANWICLFGCPNKIITDGGREFCNKVLDHLLDKLEIKHNKTSPYHPQTNAQAETYNKTIIQFIRKFLPLDSTNWTKLLPYIIISHNSAQHSSTKVTPMQLFFMFPARIPPFDQSRSYLDNFGQDLLRRLYQAYQTAEESNVSRRNQYTSYFNQKTSERTHQINDKVLVYSPILRTLMKTRKLQLPYSGPYVVIDKRSDDHTYFVKPTTGGRGFWVNIDRTISYTDPEVTQTRLKYAPYTPVPGYIPSNRPSGLVPIKRRSPRNIPNSNTYVSDSASQTSDGTACPREEPSHPETAQPTPSKTRQSVRKIVKDIIKFVKPASTPPSPKKVATPQESSSSSQPESKDEMTANESDSSILDDDEPLFQKQQSHPYSLRKNPKAKKFFDDE